MLDIRARLGGDALPVLGKIGEHREQHEAAHEIERLVEAEAVEPGIDRVRPRNAAMPVDRCRPDILDPPKQRLAAIGADHVAEHLAQEADVCIVRDRCAVHAPLLHRGVARVNRFIAPRSTLGKNVDCRQKTGYN
jgi:hypothetical protein